MLQIHWDLSAPMMEWLRIVRSFPLCFFVQGLGLSWFGTPVSKIHQTNMDVKKGSIKATVPFINSLKGLHEGLHIGDFLKRAY